MRSLAELFEKYGTDKARNGYHSTYERLFENRQDLITSVLEIGIGTLVPTAHSSMVGYAAPHYVPGGSLRAWRDYFPNAAIWGIDTQSDTQFTDDRITTALADSTNLKQLSDALGHQTFDLIIDDGDHNPVSQLVTLNYLWPRVNPGGIYVIEDIVGRSDTDLVVLHA